MRSRLSDATLVWMRKRALLEGKGLAEVILPVGSGIRTSTGPQRGFLDWRSAPHPSTEILPPLSSPLSGALSQYLLQASSFGSHAGKIISSSFNKPCQGGNAEGFGT